MIDMAVKRLREEELEIETETETETMVDSLSDMPESMRLCILSFLEARHAVKTSVLSKSWVSSWTCVPVLNFSSDGFQQFHVFDNFVLDALSRRQPVKLDRLTFKRDGTCNDEVLKQVFDYALSHGVEELEARVEPTTLSYDKWIWPIWSSDSLTSLKLVSKYLVNCSFFEPRCSGSFKNLTNLHLEWVIIRDLDPFSGFPALDKLRLGIIYLQTIGTALNVHALQLSEFTFIYTGLDVGQCEFTTPKLRYFKWSGSGFPRLKAHLPVLDTAVIGYKEHWIKNQEKKMFDNLLMMLDTLHAAKSLTLSANVVCLLALFPVNGCSVPFRGLKCLNLDFMVPHIDTKNRLLLSETSKFVPGIKAYLLHKSRDAKCYIINSPHAEESTCSGPKNCMCATIQRRAPQLVGSSAKSRPKCMSCLSETTPRQQVARSRPKRMVKKPARFLD